MRFAIFSTYFWQHQITEFGLGYAFLLYALGWLAAVLALRIANASRGRWRFVLPVVAIAPPFIGLIFVSTTYYCPLCSTKVVHLRPGPASPPPDWCEVAIIGVPFPSAFFGIDLPDVGPTTRRTDSFGEWSPIPYGYVELNVATVANFVVGLLTTPLVLAYAYRRRRPNTPLQPTAEKRGG